MRSRLNATDEEFLTEVREFLAASFTPELRAEASRQSGVYAPASLSRRWQSILYAKGWVAPSWPEQYGGTGWTVTQRYLFDTECSLQGTPILPAMGLQMCGPALIHFGTTEQKAFYLPRILSGEHYWCQGYSEPGAGSDLASLQCRAVREGTDYVINGTKIWTTHAHWANWIFLLVRTASQGKPQAGISFLLAPMSSPGITIRPILSMSGEHEINQIFFDDVRVPVENRVGEENAGWTIAKTVLEFERGGGSATGRTRRVIAETRRSAQLEADGRGGRLWDDALFRARLAEIEIETLALEHTQLQVLAGIAAGDSVGNEAASLLKLKSSELFQHATELSMDALGHYALPDQHEALEAESGAPGVGPPYAATPTARYLNARARSIFGGSNEIQREILARAALALDSGAKGS